MYGTVTADILHLRKGPSDKTPILERMQHGDRVEMLSDNNPVGAWYHIAWLPARGARLEGWAASKYIRLEQPKPPPEPEPEPYAPWIPWAFGGLAVFVLLVILLSR